MSRCSRQWRGGHNAKESKERHQISSQAGKAGFSQVLLHQADSPCSSWKHCPQVLCKSSLSRHMGLSLLFLYEAVIVTCLWVVQLSCLCCSCPAAF